MSPQVSPPTANSSNTNRPSLSCNRCTLRKVKCDRQTPCAACAKHRADCVYQPLPASLKPRRRVRQKALEDQIRKYEALLQERGIDAKELSPQVPNPAPDHAAREGSDGQAEQLYQTPSSMVSEQSQCSYKASVVYAKDRSRIVNNSLWNRVVEEVHNPEDALQGSSDDASDRDSGEDDFSFVLGHGLKTKPDLRHPERQVVLKLWHFYVSNVEPITKLVHVPTLTPAVEKAAIDPTGIPRSFEALLFSIYSMAITSIRDEDCMREFGERRKSILSRYIPATEECLARAGFMSTTSLVVLQALILHIFATRDLKEPRATWTLTGIAIRIATAMGLEQDGVHLGLPPFETEMRRRVYWALKNHDTRTAELCGMPKMRDLYVGPQTTKGPLNINDNQLYPGMTALPTNATGITDSSYVAMAHDFVGFAARRVEIARRQNQDLASWDVDATQSDRTEALDAFQGTIDAIETKYVRFCDPLQPFHFMVLIRARASMTGFRFLVHHPRRWSNPEAAPLEERNMVWDLCLKLLDYSRVLQVEASVRRFAWHAQYYLQWHAVIHVLDVLRAQPSKTDAQRAWDLINALYQDNPRLITDTMNPIYAAVGNLCLKAYTAHEAAHGPQTVPEYILQLRQQREAAREKSAQRRRQKHRNTNTTGSMTGQPSQPGATGPDMTSHVQDGMQGLSTVETQAFQLPEQIVKDNPAGNFSGNGKGDEGAIDAVEGDPFWFVQNLDPWQMSDSLDVMNMDADWLMAPAPGPGYGGHLDGFGGTIDWQQLDAVFQGHVRG